MTLLIPPPPTNSPQGDRVWTDWYIRLTRVLTTTSGIAWTAIDKSGAQLSDIPTRPHSQLTGVLGTGAYHISAAEGIAVTALAAGNVGTVTTGVWNGTDVAVADGGTGASTAGGARTNLGLVIGTDVQAYDADLLSWAGVTRASGFDTFVATPSSANLASLLTDETGTVAVAFQSTGTWTPTITFATPGDLSVTYSTQVGTYTRTGRAVTIDWNITTSAFTHTTASGNFFINGLPFANNASVSCTGTLTWQGITKAGYTDISPQVFTSASSMTLRASASGSAVSVVAVADVPTGGSLILRGTLSYFV